MNSPRAFGFDTRAVHAGQRPDPYTGARAVPIFQTTSYVFEDAESAAAYFNLQEYGNTYSRIMNPTVATFEERVASLEGGAGGVAFASGLAAQAAALFTMLQPGDHIVASGALYGGTVTQLKHLSRKFGLELTFVDPDRLDRVSGPSMAENAVSLRTGKLDAAQLFQPYAEELIASGAGHVWYAAASRGLTAYTTLVTRRNTLAKRAEELLAMTRAMHRTLRWFAATPAIEIARTLKSYFPDVSEPIFAGAIERYRALGLWGPDPVIRREGFNRLHAAMRAAGALKRDIAYETCVDTSLAERAVAEG